MSETPQMSPPIVLFYTDNGFGLGHLTRQAAIASRAGGGFRPVFLTMSAGYTLLRKLGLPAEYFPSYGRLGVTKPEWEPVMAQRLLEMIRLSGAGVLVVDHVSPPKIFATLRAMAPGLKQIWIRRGLWQPGKNAGALANSESFDLVVEPGDLAATLDVGATVARRHETIRTEPVVLTEPEEFLSRDAARDGLAISRSGRAVLINLGDPDPAIGQLLGHVAATIQRASPETIHLFAPLHPLLGGEAPRVRGLKTAPVYPVAKYLNAFDGVVSTTGYNSFHEIMGSGLPAVFVPRRNSSIDDQRRRAEFAALSGRAHWAPDVFDPRFEIAIERMLRNSEPAIASRTAAILGGLNGAREIAKIVASIARESATTSVWPGNDEPAPSSESVSETDKQLVVALDHDDRQLAELAGFLDPAEMSSTVFLVRDGNPKPLYERGAIFESILTETEWRSLGRTAYSHFLETRIIGAMNRYRATRTMAFDGGTVSPRKDEGPG